MKLYTANSRNPNWMFFQCKIAITGEFRVNDIQYMFLNGILHNEFMASDVWNKAFYFFSKQQKTKSVVVDE